MQKQQIAKYMQELVDYTRHSQLAKRDQYDIMRKIRRARKQIDAMGKRGAPNKALKTAYNQLLIAIEESNTKAMEKAVKTAIEEKKQICGGTNCTYGIGIFPKEHTPTLPIHPHCLCHLGLVRAKNLQATDRIKQGGDEGLEKQSAIKREKLLGVAGNKAWERGKDWRKYMRNWEENRLKASAEDDTIKLKDIQIYKSLGAKAKNYEVLEPATEKIFYFVEGSKIQNTTIFAGKGVKKPLNEAVRNGLASQLGENPNDWSHCKGNAVLDYYGESRKAEVHWFQCEGVGKVKFKVKRWDDES